MTGGRPDAGPALVPRSALPGVGWPALPGPEAGRLLAVLFQLEQSQWWTPEILRRHQLAQADPLLRHAYATAPFHRDRLAAVGYRPGAPLDADLWRRLPLLTREDLRDHRDAVRSEKPPPEHGEPFVATTSGSTGRPVEVARTPLTQLFWQALTVRDHLWHRRDLREKLGVIRYVADPAQAAPPRGAPLPSWGAASGSLYETGPGALLAIQHSVRAQAKWLRRQDPAYLLSYPSALEGVARRLRDKGRRLPSLRQVLTVSEMLPPARRRLLEEVFGVPVVDTYSTQEAGYLALQCPDHPRYHVQAETVLLEVLDDDGRPCAPGQVGRVVVTDLHNFATPLLRYDLGDLAEVGGPCPCGRGLPVLERILGRVRNLLVYPDGRRTWPFFTDRGLEEIAPIRQFQVVQRALDHLELRMVVDRPVTAEEEARLKVLLHDQLDQEFEVTLTRVDRIERGPGGKFEDFRSEVDG